MAAKLYTIKECACGYKALIAAQYVGKRLETPEYDPLKGAPKSPLGKFGPVLETPDGLVYGADAAARAVAADSALLRGTTAFEGALVEQWVEFAARDVDLPAAAWVLPLICPDTPALPAAVKKAKADMRKVMAVLNAHLLTRTFLVGERPTLADVCVFCALLEPYRRVLDPGFRKDFKNLNRWFATMAHQPQVVAVVGEVVLCTKAQEPKYAEEHAAAAAAAPAKKEKKPQQPKAEPKPKAAEADDEDEEEKPKDKKPPNPLDLLPPSKMSMDGWKRVYSNEDTKTVALPWLWENFDPEGFSIWFCRYKYELSATMVFQAANLLSGFIQRLDPLRKYGFGSLLIFGEQKPFQIEGVWIFRGKEIPKEMTDCDDCELYEWTRADVVADKAKIEAYLTWEGNFGSLPAFNQGKIFK